MTEAIFQRVVVPVANHNDPAATAIALVPYVDQADCSVAAVHGIEKDGGAPETASVEQREQQASDIFATVIEGFDDTEVTLETDLRYGTDVAAAIIDVAHDSTATAIVFTPHGGSRWRKLLSGDGTHNLVWDGDVPILVLHDPAVSEA